MGLWDFEKMGFGENGIWGKWDLGKVASWKMGKQELPPIVTAFEIGNINIQLTIVTFNDINIVNT